jgi:hypothetical protein
VKDGHFERPGKSLKRFKLRDRKTIFCPGYVVASKPKALLQVILGRFLVLASCMQSFTDDQRSPSFSEVAASLTSETSTHQRSATTHHLDSLLVAWPETNSRPLTSKTCRRATHQVETLSAFLLLVAVSELHWCAWCTNQQESFLKFMNICEDTAAITPRVYVMPAGRTRHGECQKRFYAVIC